MDRHTIVFLNEYGALKIPRTNFLLSTFCFYKKLPYYLRIADLSVTQTSNDGTGSEEKPHSPTSPNFVLHPGCIHLYYRIWISFLGTGRYSLLTSSISLSFIGRKRIRCVMLSRKTARAARNRCIKHSDQAHDQNGPQSLVWKHGWI